jgi:regulatory protein
MDEDKTYQEEFADAMNAAIHLLSRRNHTKYEIRQKLKQRGFIAEIISRVLAECERLNYVDDEKTAQFYLRELGAKGYGKQRIRFSMKKKGLDHALTEKLLSEEHSETEEMENARRLFESRIARFNREKDAGKRREKIYRFLYSRGFSPSLISKLIREEK